jgi:predicted GNAT superfamily acetyltransferase
MRDQVGLLSQAESAAAAAATAADDAGVTVRLVTDPPELRAVCRLFDGIWRSDPADAAVTPSLLRALSKAGNYVAGVYDRSDLVGACVGFFAAPTRHELHSHIAGVSAAARGRSVGRAMKLHQRAWALSQGVATVTWTFDPLVSRNAYFNLIKLGGTPVQYLPDFYGSMGDAINADDSTDRLLVKWDLTAGSVERAARGLSRHWDEAALRESGAVVGLGRSADGEPFTGTPDGRIVLVAVPPDIESLRRAGPACARRWRAAVRDVLGPLFDQGTSVAGFDRAGWYVLDRGENR